jgi:hypothetical protein
MKHLLLSLTVLTMLVSCGKDNKGDSSGAAAATSASTAASNAVTIADPAAVALGTLIDNYSTSFGVGMATYYETWSQLVANSPNVTYDYTVPPTTTSASVNWSFCFITCSGSATTAVTISRSVVHSSINILAKQNELIKRVHFMESQCTTMFTRSLLLTTKCIIST